MSYALPSVMFLASFALAHVPHDNVAALAAPADLATSPWLLVADPVVMLLLRSDDQGRTWTMIGGDPVVEDLNGAARLDDGSFHVLGATRLWSSSDDATTWSAEPLPATLNGLVSQGDTLLAAGDGGVWEGVPGAWVEVWAEPVRALATGAFATQAGEVWVKDDGWTSLGAPTSAQVFSVVADGPRVWVGDLDGAVWSWDGVAWAACGALPKHENPEIARLAVAGTEVLAAPAWGAPFASDDGCATWADRRIPEPTVFGVNGGAASGGDAFTVLEGTPERWIVAGWAGLYTSEDRGATWTDAALLPADYTRGLAVGDDGSVWTAAYGSGVGRTDDGGATFTWPTYGMDAANAQRVHRTGTRLHAISGHVAWTSEDGGSEWTAFGAGSGFVDAVVAFTEDHVLLSADLVVNETRDGGVTFEVAEALDALVAGRGLAGAARIDDRFCVLTKLDAQLLCTADEGITWASIGGSGGDDSSGPVAWPPDAPTSLVWADDAGVHRILGDAIDVAWDEDAPQVLEVTQDGTLFLATRTGRLWRSADGGTEWADLDARVPALVYALATHRAGALLIATHDGTWMWTEDAGLRRWAAWQRIDDQAVLATCASCGTPVEYPGAGMGVVTPMPEGATLTTWVRGERVRVLGLGAGAPELEVDGVQVASGTGGQELGTAIEADVDPGWHAVVVTGSGSFAIDAVEAWSDSDTLAEEEGAEPEPDAAADPAKPVRRACGCGGGDAAGLFVLAWGWRRRARD